MTLGPCLPAILPRAKWQVFVVHRSTISRQMSRHQTFLESAIEVLRATAPRSVPELTRARDPRHPLSPRSRSEETIPSAPQKVRKGDSHAALPEGSGTSSGCALRSPPPSAARRRNRSAVAERRRREAGAGRWRGRGPERARRIAGAAAGAAQEGVAAVDSRPRGRGGLEGAPRRDPEERLRRALAAMPGAVRASPAGRSRRGSMPWRRSRPVATAHRRSPRRCRLSAQYADEARGGVARPPPRGVDSERRRGSPDAGRDQGSGIAAAATRPQGRRNKKTHPKRRATAAIRPGPPRCRAQKPSVSVSRSLSRIRNLDRSRRARTTAAASEPVMIATRASFLFPAAGPTCAPAARSSLSRGMLRSLNDPLRCRAAARRIALNRKLSRRVRGGVALHRSAIAGDAPLRQPSGGAPRPHHGGGSSRSPPPPRARGARADGRWIALA